MNKIILITGVTSGVGKELVKFYLNKGCKVIGLARRKSYLNNSNFKSYSVDISNKIKLQKVFKDITKKYKKIDILINNAAIFKSKRFEEYSYDDINDIININLKGLIYCTYEAFKLLNSPEKSNVINISSVSGLKGIKKQSIYSASKHGIKGFSEALQQETVNNNIRVTTLFIGGIDTELWNENNPYNGNKKELLKTTDICNLIDYIVNLPSRVILKEITMFPSIEWH